MRAVVFDFDGVILDTETPEFRAWAEVYDRYGCVLAVEEWATGIGTHGGFDPWGTLSERAPGPLPPESQVQGERRARQRELLDEITLLPGVLEWLDDAAAHDVAVALASSSPPDWIDPFLERFGLRGRFACMACCDGSLPPKPDPDSYLHACRTLGVVPAEAIAVEDSPNGIRASKAAGLFTVAVPNPLTAGLDLGEADMVVPSLETVTLVDVIRAAKP